MKRIFKNKFLVSAIAISVLTLGLTPTPLFANEPQAVNAIIEAKPVTTLADENAKRKNTSAEKQAPSSNDFLMNSETLIEASEEKAVAGPVTIAAGRISARAIKSKAVTAGNTLRVQYNLEKSPTDNILKFGPDDRNPRVYNFTGYLRELTGHNTLQRTAFEFTAVSAEGRKKIFIIDGRSSEDIAEKLRHAIEVNGGKNIAMKFVESMILEGVQLHNALAIENVIEKKYPSDYFTFDEFLDFRATFGLKAGDDGYNDRFDFTGDGTVGVDDFGFFRKHYKGDTSPREYSLTGNLRELTGYNTLQRTAFEFTAINADGKKQVFIIDGRNAEDIADKLRHAILVNGGQNIAMKFVESMILEGVQLHNALAIENVIEKKYPSDYFTFDEFLDFRATFGLKAGDDGYNDRFDFTGDGTVGVDDFGFFRKHYKGDTKPREYSLTGNLRELTGYNTLQRTAFEFTAINADGKKQVFIIDGRNAEDIADKLRHAILVNGGQNIAMKFVESMILEGVQLHNALAIENVIEKKYPSDYFTFDEFLSFRATFGLKAGDKGYNDRFDFTGDGVVGIDDFGFFRKHYKGDTSPREYSLTGNLRELTGPSTLQRTAFEFTAINADGNKQVFIIDGRNAEDIADKLRHAILVNGGQNIAMKFVESMILEGVQLHNALAIENVIEKKYPSDYFTFDEFLSFRATFGLKAGDKGYNDRFDFTGDGVVGIDDFGFFRKHYKGDTSPREYSLTGNLRELTGYNTLQRTAFEFTAINADGKKQVFIIDGRNAEDIADKLRHAIEVNGGKNIAMKFVESMILEGVQLHNALAIENVIEKKYPADYFSEKDFEAFKATFGLKNGDKGYNDRFDFNDDGVVGIADFSFFRKHFKGDTTPREYSLTGNLRELTGYNTLQRTAFEFTAINADGKKQVFIIDGRNAEDIAAKLRHAIIVNGGQNIAMKFVESMILEGVQLHNALAIENVIEKKYPADYFSEKDFEAFKATFGLKNGDKGYNDRFDFNDDGVVGVSDFGFFRKHFKGDTSGEREKLIAYIDGVNALADHYHEFLREQSKRLLGIDLSVSQEELKSLIEAAGLSNEEAARLMNLHVYFRVTQAIAEVTIAGDTGDLLERFPEVFTQYGEIRPEFAAFMQKEGLELLFLEVMMKVDPNGMSIEQLREAVAMLQEGFGGDVNGDGITDLLDARHYVENIMSSLPSRFNHVLNSLERINAEFEALRDAAGERSRLIEYINGVNALAETYLDFLKQQSTRLLGIDLSVSKEELKSLIEAAGLSNEEAARLMNLHVYFRVTQAVAEIYINEDYSGDIFRQFPEVFTQYGEIRPEFAAFMQKEGLELLFLEAMTKVDPNGMSIEQLREAVAMLQEVFGGDTNNDGVIDLGDAQYYVERMITTLTPRFDEVLTSLERINAEFEALRDAAGERSRLIDYINGVNALADGYHEFLKQQSKSLLEIDLSVSQEELKSLIEAAGLSNEEAARLMNLHVYFRVTQAIAEVTIAGDTGDLLERFPEVFTQYGEIRPEFAAFMQKEGLELLFLEVMMKVDPNGMSIEQLREAVAMLQEGFGGDVNGDGITDLLDARHYVENIMSSLPSRFNHVINSLVKINLEFEALRDAAGERSRLIEYINGVNALAETYLDFLKQQSTRLLGIDLSVSKEELKSLIEAAGLSNEEAARLMNLHVYFRVTQAIAEIYINEDYSGDIFRQFPEVFTQYGEIRPEFAAFMQKEGLELLFLEAMTKVDPNGMSIEQLREAVAMLQEVFGGDTNNDGVIDLGDAQYYVERMITTLTPRFDDVLNSLESINAEFEALRDAAGERSRLIEYINGVNALADGYHEFLKQQSKSLLEIDLSVSQEELKSLIEAAGLSNEEAARLMNLHVYFRVTHAIAEVTIAGDTGDLLERFPEVFTQHGEIRQEFSAFMQKEGLELLFLEVMMKVDPNGMSIEQLREAVAMLQEGFGGDVNGDGITDLLDARHYVENIMSSLPSRFNHVINSLVKINLEFEALRDAAGERSRLIEYINGVNALAETYLDFLKQQSTRLLGIDLSVSKEELKSLIEAAGLSNEEAARLMNLHVYFRVTQAVAEIYINEDYSGDIFRQFPEVFTQYGEIRPEFAAFMQKEGLELLFLEAMTKVDPNGMSIEQLREAVAMLQEVFGGDTNNDGVIDLGDAQYYVERMITTLTPRFDDVLNSLESINAEFEALRDAAGERSRLIEYINGVNALADGYHEFLKQQSKSLLEIDLSVSQEELKSLIEAAGLSNEEAARLMNLHVYFRVTHAIAEVTIAGDTGDLLERFPEVFTQHGEIRQEFSAFMQKEGLELLFLEVMMKVDPNGMSIEQLREAVAMLQEGFGGDVNGDGITDLLDARHYVENIMSSLPSRFNHVINSLVKINLEFEALRDAAGERSRLIEYINGVNALAETYLDFLKQQSTRLLGIDLSVSKEELKSLIEAAGLSNEEAARLMNLHVYFRVTQAVAEIYINEDYSGDIFRQFPEVFTQYGEIRPEFAAFMQKEGLELLFLEAMTKVDPNGMSIEQLREAVAMLQEVFGGDTNNDGVIDLGDAQYYVERMITTLTPRFDDVLNSLESINAEFEALRDAGRREYSLTGYLRELTGYNTLQRTAFEFIAINANGEKQVFIIDGRSSDDIAAKLRHAIKVNGGQNIAMKFVEAGTLEGVKLHNALAIENVVEKKYPADYFNNNDFSAFKATYGRKAGDKGYNDRYDFNGDGVVGIDDFGFFRKHFGKR